MRSKQALNTTETASELVSDAICKVLDDSYAPRGWADLLVGGTSVFETGCGGPALPLLKKQPVITVLFGETEGGDTTQSEPASYGAVRVYPLLSGGYAMAVSDEGNLTQWFQSLP